MSHLRHHRFYKIPPRGPIFIDGSIVTKVCYSISPLGKQNLYFKKHVKMSTNFKVHQILTRSHVIYRLFSLSLSNSSGINVIQMSGNGQKNVILMSCKCNTNGHIRMSYKCHANVIQMSYECHANCSWPSQCLWIHPNFTLLKSCSDTFTIILTSQNVSFFILLFHHFILFISDDHNSG